MNPLDASILSLTKRLAGAKWIEVYEILLCSLSRSQHVEDVKYGGATMKSQIFALSLGGNEYLALKLIKLTGGAHRDDTMLTVLALCAQNTIESTFKSLCGPFPLAPDVRGTNLRISHGSMFSLPKDTELQCSFILSGRASQPLVKCGDAISKAATNFLNLDKLEELKAPVRSLPLQHDFVGCTHFRDGTSHVKSAEGSTDIGCHGRTATSNDARMIFHLLTNGQEQARPRQLPMLPSQTKDMLAMNTRRRHHMQSCFCCSRSPTYIVSKNLLWQCSADVHSHDFEGLCNRAKLCGSLYQSLVCFSETYSYFSNRMLSSISRFAHNMAQDYLLRILAVKSQWEDSVISSPALIFAAEKSKDDMFTSLELFRSIELSQGSSSSILDILYDALSKNHGAPTVQSLFVAALGPYVEMIWDWVFYGSTVRDVGNEFFGTILGKCVTDSESLVHNGGQEEPSISEAVNPCPCPVPNVFSLETALFILRAGRSRRLLELLCPDDPLFKQEPPQFAYPFSFGQLHEVANKLVSMPLNDGLTTPASERPRSYAESKRMKGRGWCYESDAHYQSVIPKSKKAKYFSIPCDEVEDHGENSPMFSFVECFEKTSSPDSTDVNMRTASSPHIFFENIIIGKIREADRSTQRKILNHFVGKLRVFEHLRFLCGFALLGAGDFANVLVDQICDADATSSENEKYITRRVSASRTFYGTSGAGAAAFRKRRHLAACLRTALSMSNSDHNDLAENFSIVVEDSERINTSLWNSAVRVEYLAEFPLNLIISPEALALYTKFFNFFLSVRRAQSSLRSLFILTRRRSVLERAMNSWRSSLAMRRCRMSLWQFCWHAEHFVSIVGGYELYQIHGLSWTDFESSWASMSTIWELREEHMKYLNDSVRRVLLGQRQRSVMNVITSALKIIFDVESKIVTVAEDCDNFVDGREVDFEGLLFSATEGLKRRAVFLIDVLEKLVANGSHPHLQDFLTRLNFNSYYKTQTLPC